MVISSNSSTEDGDLENEFKFEPPLYRQRYRKVYEVLIDEKWKEKLNSLVDFGCAEFKLFVYVKSTTLTEIYFVDIDEDLLEEKIMLIHPLAIDFLKRRRQPLKVSVFAGSVTDPDFRLVNRDVVTAVELIEHLFPDELEAFVYNIFHHVNPKMAIITTPNADFNIIFSSDTKRFRHPDHKFEWTRHQFEEWSKNITRRFPDFTVMFYGIGEAPETVNENIGECSQMALFLRKDLIYDNYSTTLNNIPCICDSTSCKNFSLENLCKCFCASCLPSNSYGICTYYSYSKLKHSDMCKDENNPNFYYKCLKNVAYPIDDDCRTDEEKIFDEIRYRINNCMNNSDIIENMELNSRYEIPLTLLLTGAKDLHMSIEELRELLQENDYIIEDCINQQNGTLETCVIISPPESDMEEISSSSDVPTNKDDDHKFCFNEPDSNWDDSEDVDKKCTSSTKGSNGNSWESEVTNIQNDKKDGLKIEEFQPPIVALNSNQSEIAQVSDLENDELQSDTSSCVGRASNEAIVGGDSQPDSLADFEIPPPIQEANGVSDTRSIFLIGMQPRHSSHDEMNNLQGVHPSVNTVEGEDDTTDSSNNTVDYAEMEPGVSSQETSSLPEDLQELEDSEMQPTGSEPSEDVNSNSNSFNPGGRNVQDPNDNIDS